MKFWHKDEIEGFQKGMECVEKMKIEKMTLGKGVTPIQNYGLISLLVKHCSSK